MGKIAMFYFIYKTLTLHLTQVVYKCGVFRAPWEENLVHIHIKSVSSVN